MEINLKKIWGHENRLKRLRKTRKGLRGLREGLNTRELEEQYLRYLNVEGEKGELSSLMTPEGQLVLRQRLQKAEYKHLVHLLQIVRHNRQRVKHVLLFVFGFVAAFSIAVAILLKSPLFAAFLEHRLSLVLGTEVSIHSPTLRWNGTLEYAGIGISKPQVFSGDNSENTENSAKSDYTKPNYTKNHKIAELGPGSVKISISALLQNKILLDQFFSQYLVLKSWGENVHSTSTAAAGQAQNTAEETLIRLDSENIIANAKNNFTSFQEAGGVSRNMAAGKDWDAEIRQNQQQLNENYTLLNSISARWANQNNGEQLMDQNRSAENRIERQALRAAGQVAEVNKQLENSNAVLNSLSATFDQNFQALQQKILDGDLLLAPVRFLTASYLRDNLQNFSQITLWLASVFDNLQQFQRNRSPYAGQKSEVSPLFQSFLEANDGAVADYSYKFPGLLYANFDLRYLEAGTGDQSANLKLSDLSSDGDISRNPVVAVFDSEEGGSQSHLQLLYDNRQLPASRKSRHPSECNVYGIDICENAGQMQAVFTKDVRDLTIPGSYFDEAQLEFIKSYTANGRLEITVVPVSNEVKIHSKLLQLELRPDLHLQVQVNLEDPALMAEDNVNSLQQAVLTILQDYPLQLQAKFYLSEKFPQTLLQLQVKSNVEGILAQTINQQGQGDFQNTITQLRSRLNTELHDITQPLQREITELYNYRYRLQQQFNTFTQQKNTASTAPDRIRRELQRQRNPAPIQQFSEQPAEEPAEQTGVQPFDQSFGQPTEQQEEEEDQNDNEFYFNFN